MKVVRTQMAVVVVALVALLGNAAQAESVAALSQSSLDAAKASVDAEPSDVGRRLAYARMLTAVFLFEDARQQLQAAIKVNGEDATAWFELAKVEALSGNRGVAGSHAQKARGLGSEAAVELFERLSAAVRIHTGKKHMVKEGPAAGVVAELALALKSGDAAKAAGHLAVPSWVEDGTAEGTLKAYGQYLQRVAGVEWLDYELAQGASADEVRVRLFWRVAPANMNFDALASLPPVYRALLPLAWTDGLSLVGDPKLRADAIARATAAQWTDVTLLTATVTGGKVVALRNSAGNVLAEELPVVTKSSAAGPGAKEADKDAVEEKALRREMFRNRYGKREAYAEGEPYMWRQILFGLFICVLCAIGLFWLVRREVKKGRGDED